MRALSPWLVLTCLLLPQALPASVVQDHPIEAMAVAADAVVLGEVVDRRTVPVDGGRRLVTLVTVEVTEALAGDPGQTVELQVPGGTLDGLTQKVVGLRVPEVGQTLALFLERRPGRRVRWRLPALGLSVFEVQGEEAVRQTEGVEVRTGPLDGPGVRGASEVAPARSERLPVSELARRVRAARAEAARDGGQQ